MSRELEQISRSLNFWRNIDSRQKVNKREKLFQFSFVIDPGLIPLHGHISELGMNSFLVTTKIGDLGKGLVTAPTVAEYPLSFLFGSVLAI